MLGVNLSEKATLEQMPSLNHSYICIEILRQLLENKDIQPLSELTLDIDKGLTPDIAVYLKHQIKPNFLRDVARVKELPILAIEVISASQNIQDLLEKAATLVKAGVQTVWTVEPFSQTIFVTDSQQERIIHSGVIESENIKVDFGLVFRTE